MDVFLFLRNVVSGFFLLAGTTLSSSYVWATDSVVILLYHHVSNTTPPSTSVSPAQFLEHMQYLSEHHNVIDLVDAVDRLQHQQPLPDNAVVITFDDGYRNILENGDPILRQFDFPYTIFVNPALIGTRANQLTWPQVKRMSQRGVRFANHTLKHGHLLNKLANETHHQWLARLRHDIETAESQLAAQIGYSLKYLAYPYGEFNNDVRALIKDLSYVGFGQHSGAVSSVSDFRALPRFPAAGRYASLQSLRLKMSSLAMPLKTSNIDDTVVVDGILPDPVELTFMDSITPTNEVACFYNGDSLPVTSVNQTISVAFTAQLPIGRSRINCTSPSPQYPGRYHWFSQPFFRPDHTGQFID